MNQQPDLSIIIPTHNRRDLLRRVLNSLATQSYPANRFEVVVIADACEDGTEIMVEELVVQLPIFIRVFSHNERSASLTRNRGAKEARSRHLLFLDDDIIASRELVAAHMDLKDVMQVVLGYSKPVIPETASWWQLNARIWWEDRYQEMRTPGYRVNYRDFYSGNVSLPADLFEQVGGFDPAIGNRLEDYELGYRLLKVGARFMFHSAALGYHHDYSDLQLWLNRTRLEGVADVQMSRLHSELSSRILSDPFEGADRIVHRIRKLSFDGSKIASAFKHVALWMARSCQYLKLRGVYFYVIKALREYYYWSGVADASGGEHSLRSILQQAPPTPALDLNAPELDLAAIPDENTVARILAVADHSGLQLAYEGHEIINLAPVPGSESLKIEHIDRLFQDYLSNNFLPARSLSYLQEEMKENGY
jgi:glycosyltransferase involved in cell wall biosynthesis